ncbi:MAG: hypothetical protein HOP91_04975 [Sphingomonas sp.]|nr:hypothetical protein [Sphingomonas sp.]
MRSVLLALAAIALMAESSPPSPQPQVAQFQQALAAFHFTDAVAVLDKLVEQRIPADGKPRQDPLLNALFGQFYLAAREYDPAATYLDRAPISELPVSIRVATALAHGRALEIRGDRAAALAAYRETATAAGSDEERRRATLGIARQLLPDNPSALRSDLAAIASGPLTPERWRANYLLALAASLTGDTQAAARLADQAWADAVAAPLNDLASLHVATLRAGLAAARHDQVTERAMLLATNGQSVSASNWLSSQLPVCGERGISPSDFVIFGYVSGPFAGQELVPIAASRPAAVAPFADSLAGITPIDRAHGYAPVGTVFTVACRSHVSFDYMSKPPLGDPLLNWFVDRGLYPASASNDADDKHIGEVAARVDSLSARFGPSSPLLIVPRWQMMTMLEGRARGGDNVLPGQISDLAKQIASGMRQAAAPDWLPQIMESRNDYEQTLSTTGEEAERMTALTNVTRTFMMRVPIGYARQLLAEERSNFHDDWPAPFAQMIVGLNPNATSLTGRERQAWLLMLAEAQRILGRTKEAHATMTSAGIPPDLCIANDAAPSLLEQHFTYKDYPDNLIAGDQEGAVLFDFDLSPSGKLAGKRIVYSLPSGLFDEPSAKGLSTVRYTPPTKNGKPVTCRGIYQPIVWRLEGEHDFTLPRLTPEISDDKVS